MSESSAPKPPRIPRSPKAVKALVEQLFGRASYLADRVNFVEDQRKAEQRRREEAERTMYEVGNEATRIREQTKTSADCLILAFELAQREACFGLEGPPTGVTPVMLQRYSLLSVEAELEAPASLSYAKRPDHQRTKAYMQASRKILDALEEVQMAEGVGR